MKKKLQAAQRPKSRAFYRVHAVRKLTGSETEPAKPPCGSLLAITSVSEVELNDKSLQGKTLIGFACDHYSVMESGGSITVQVNRTGPAGGACSVAYTTADLTANAGSDYEASTGTLTFAPNERSQSITIKILDDDVEEDDEQFLIRLTAPVSADVELRPGLGETLVSIINDDFPGTFVFPQEEVTVKETEGVVRLRVERVKGCSGEVRLKYATKDGSALAGSNYTAAAGSLSWAHGDVAPKFIEVPITDDDVLQGRQYFDVVIDEATGGALFDKNTDGKADRSLARVTIEDDEVITTLADRAVAFLGMGQQDARLGAETWQEQFTSALRVGGDDGDEGQQCSRRARFRWC